jgi:ABC-type phosphate transport system substrate-binding protein
MKMLLFQFIILTSFFLGCYNEPKETPTKGNLTVYVDETIFPLVQKEKDAFEAGYPNAKIVLSKVSTDGGFNQLLNHNAKLFIGSRNFNDVEDNFVQSQKMYIRVMKFVYDGVAVITSKNTDINYLSTKELSNILLGKDKSYHAMIPDSNTGTYFLIKKVLLDNKNPVNAEMIPVESSIIDKIPESRKTLGFVGINLIKDTTNFKILKVSDLVARNGEVAYYSPHPAFIYKNYYPLSRTVYIFLNEIENGLASGFATYLTANAGQKIALKDNLAPAAVPVKVNE